MSEELSIDTGPARPDVGGTVPASNEAEAVDRRRFGLWTLTAVFMAESLVLGLLQRPANLDFLSFALMDRGANLTVQGLLDRGLVPTIDFGYQYGLVALAIGRSWFALLGRTPAAYALAMMVIDLLIAWGLARCAHALRAGPVGIALIIFTIPGTTLASYINFAHAGEAGLICHALAEHAYGRRSRALAILTACLFMKPVMAYVYGFLLVLLIVRSEGIRRLVRSAVPAAVTGVLFFMGLAAWLGPEAVIRSLSPLRGVGAYRILNHGFFFGIGQPFWYPEDVKLRYYVFSTAGHYLAGSVILIAAAITSIWRLARRPFASDEVNTELIACCGIMHLSFLTYFYGAPFSWCYYYYILIIGLVAMANRGRRSMILIALLAIAAFVGDKDFGGSVKHMWRDLKPGGDTFGLWADTASREEWRQVRQLLGDKPACLVANNGGCLELFMPQFVAPEDIFMTPGYPTDAELQRKLARVTNAEVVLISKQGCVRPMLELWPEIREAIKGFELVKSTENFLVYERRRPGTLRQAEPQRESAKASQPL
jgi:hypothetical protein